MRTALLYLDWIRCRWLLAHAREFRRELEVTIARERLSAQHAIEDAEIEASRAHIAYLEARAQARITTHQSTQGAKT